jgi:hypothetical protein
MVWTVLIENLEISDIQEAVCLYIDMRVPKIITLTTSAWSNNPQDSYVQIEEKRLWDLINDLYVKTINIRATTPIIKNNGIWVKYLKFFRISRDKFTILDRHDEAIFGISDLEIDFKNYTA